VLGAGWGQKSARAANRHRRAPSSISQAVCSRRYTEAARADTTTLRGKGRRIQATTSPRRLLTTPKARSCRAGPSPKGESLCQTGGGREYLFLSMLTGARPGLEAPSTPTAPMRASVATLPTTLRRFAERLHNEISHCRLGCELGSLQPVFQRWLYYTRSGIAVLNSSSASALSFTSPRTPGAPVAISLRAWIQSSSPRYLRGTHLDLP
jgi:hypothetical protein